MFTGGKWEVTKWSSHRHLHVSSDDQASCYGSLKFVADCGNYDEKDGLPYNCDVEDNARLISSAPDMYQALKAFECAFKEDTIMASGFATKMMLGEAIEKARNAIAKAEGQDAKKQGLD